MTRRRKTGNYSEEDRRLILHAAVSDASGLTLGDKQQWLMNRGVHRPGVPSEPVSESALNYWRNAHRKVTIMAQDQYDRAMEELLSSPPSYRALKSKLPILLSGSKEPEE